MNVVYTGVFSGDSATWPQDASAWLAKAINGGCQFLGCFCGPDKTIGMFVFGPPGLPL